MAADRPYSEFYAFYSVSPEYFGYTLLERCEDVILEDLAVQGISPAEDSNCWYSETNVMHFLFNLLRIKDPYMFQGLLAHPQEALYKQHLVYCVRVMSVGCTRIEVEIFTPSLVAANRHNTHTIYQLLFV
jgi:hypothetical protein